jgi:hypothetical protein
MFSTWEMNEGVQALRGGQSAPYGSDIITGKFWQFNWKQLL